MYIKGSTPIRFKELSRTLFLHREKVGRESVLPLLLTMFSGPICFLGLIYISICFCDRLLFMFFTIIFFMCCPFVIIMVRLDIGALYFSIIIPLSFHDVWALIGVEYVCVIFGCSPCIFIALKILLYRNVTINRDKSN